MKESAHPESLARTRAEHQRPALLSLLLVLLTVVVPLRIIPPHFQTNDDVVYMLLLSGQVLSSEPSELIYWFHPFLSYTLAWLYRLHGDIPWYGFMHLGSLVLALWAIVYAVLRKDCSWPRVGLCWLCVITLGLPFVFSLQFTKTALLAGLGGILLLATTLQQYSTARSSRRGLALQIGGGLFLLSLSFSIRNRSLLLISVLSLPLVGFLAWTAWRTRTLRVFFGVLASVSLVLLTLAFVDLQLYATSPEWGRFNRVNLLKSEFLDYQHIRYTTESQRYFQEVGWSENDYRCPEVRTHLLNWPPNQGKSLARDEQTSFYRCAARRRSR